VPIGSWCDVILRFPSLTHTGMSRRFVARVLSDNHKLKEIVLGRAQFLNRMV